MKCNQSKNRITTPFGDFQVDVENLFDQFFGDRAPEASSRWLPRTNVSETDKSYHLSMELPGVKPADVAVEVQDGVLEISGSREAPELAEGVRQLKREQRIGKFGRKFEFAIQIDADKIEARYEHGVLLVDLPKSEKVLPRKIDIQVAE